MGVTDGDIKNRSRVGTSSGTQKGLLEDFGIRWLVRSESALESMRWSYEKPESSALKKLLWETGTAVVGGEWRGVGCHLVLIALAR